MMYTCAAEFDFIEAEVGDMIRTIYFLAIGHKGFFFTSSFHVFSDSHPVHQNHAPSS